METAQKYTVFHNPTHMDYETMEFLINEKLSPIGGFFDGDTFIFRTQVIAVSAMSLIPNVVLLPIDPHKSECVSVSASVSASYENENDFIDKSENQTWENLAISMIDFN